MKSITLKVILVLLIVIGLMTVAVLWYATKKAKANG